MDVLSNLFTSIIDWYMANVNYGTITALMTIESSFIPFPSEAIIPQAAFKAAAGELNIVLVVLFASLGAMFGAYINYFLARYLGRTLIYRFAETRVAAFFLIKKEKIIKAENYFVTNGKSSTLIGRLVPGIRQLISIPAGLAKMPLLAFSVYTFIGATLWNIVLAALGYWAHGQADLMKHYQEELSLGALLLGALFIAYLIVSGLKKKKKKSLTHEDKKQFGIIGYPLTASFSRNFFNEKFEKEHINAQYDLFPIEKIDFFPSLIQEKSFAGMNVTIPHKQAVMSCLDELDETAKEIGAVNVIQFRTENGVQKTKGFNSDAIGFENSLLPLLKAHHNKALVLGTGGAAKAVTYILRKNNIPYTLVSRTKAEGQYTYDELTPEIMAENTLIINTTPLGMYPVDSCPAIPYENLTSQHLLYDLVYNPEKTVFLAKGEEQGAAIKNGLEMLYGQARAAWEIWNQ